MVRPDNEVFAQLLQITLLGLRKPPARLPSRPPPASSLADTLFGSIDVDASGCISMDEFVEWWDVHASGSAEDEATLDAAIDIFEELDEDDSGQMDRTEFKEVLGILQEREWVAATDPTSGRRYFRNRLTREAKWDEPPSDDEAVDKWLERTFAVLSGGEVPEARRLVV